MDTVLWNLLVHAFFWYGVAELVLIVYFVLVYVANAPECHEQAADQALIDIHNYRSGPK